MEQLQKILIDESIKVATLLHMKQRRKGYDNLIPYIAHPLDVYRFLIEHDVRDAIILSAAILHDVIEDCTDNIKNAEDLKFTLGLAVGTSSSENGCFSNDRVNQLCDEVVSLVELLTHDKSKGSKDEYMKSFANVDERAFLIKCADRICNVRDFAKTDPEYAKKYMEKAQPLWDRVTDVVHERMDGRRNSPREDLKYEGLYVDLYMMSRMGNVRAI